MHELRRAYSARVAALVALAAVVSEAPAHAHAPPRGFGVVVGSAAAPLVVRTNRGLVFDSPSGPRLICQAGFGALTSERLPVVPAAGGGFLVGTVSGVVHLGDDGCPGERAPRLDRGAIQDLVAHPARPDELYAVTADQSVSSGLFRSTDGGATFQLVVELEPDEFFNAVAVDPTTAGGAYVSGARVNRERGEAEHFVAHVDPGGELERFVVALEPYELQLRVLSVAARDGDVVVARTEAATISGEPDRLLRSRDGGRSFETWRAAAGIAELSRHAGTGQSWLASDDGLLSSEAGGDFASVELERPPSCVHAAGDELWVCDSLGVHVSSDGGRSFAPELLFVDVEQPVSCAADDSSDAQPLEPCQQDWQDFSAEMALVAQALAAAPGAEAVPDSGEPSAELGLAAARSSSGCSASRRGTARIPWATLALIAALLGRRVRRARAAPDPAARGRARGTPQGVYSGSGSSMPVRMAITMRSFRRSAACRHDVDWRPEAPPRHSLRWVARAD